MLHKGGKKTNIFYHRKTLANNDKDNEKINKDSPLTPSRPTIFRMKSQEEYSREQNKPDVPIRRYLPEMGLTDLILNYTNPLMPPHNSDDDKQKGEHYNIFIFYF